MENLVSIIVPCYNQGDYLGQTLNSIINQSYSNWECFIINDGSTDNTEDIAFYYSNKYSKLRYYKTKNAGLSSARNFGISKSNGEFIVCLDSDDIMHKDFLSFLIKQISERFELGVISFKTKCFEKSINKTTKDLVYDGSTIKDILFSNKLVASSMFRKKCWIECGGYDTNMKFGFEDWEFWINILKRGWKYDFVDEFLFYYRKKKKSMLINTYKYSYERNLEYIFKKHYDLYEDFKDEIINIFIELAKQNNFNKNKYKESVDFKLGKFLLKPFRIIYDLGSYKK